MAADVTKLRCHIFNKALQNIYSEMYGVSCKDSTLALAKAINYEFIYSRRLICDVEEALVCEIENAIKKLPTYETCDGETLDCGLTVTVVDPNPVCAGTITVIRIT